MGLVGQLLQVEDELVGTEVQVVAYLGLQAVQGHSIIITTNLSLNWAGELVAGG